MENQEINDNYNTDDSENTIFHSIDEANDFLLHQLHGCFETEDIIENSRIYLPEWDVYIIPDVSEIKENIAHIYYHITSPGWNTVLFEVSSAMGANMRQAIGMAQGSFIFGIVNALTSMAKDENPISFETEFSGNTHKWKAYVGNIVGMGKTPSDITPNVYWESLKDGISKRIGNQKLCYVKIYGANIGNGSYTGECRINDVKIDELSEIVENMVKTWGTTEFGSHKQFFMIKQDEETILDYPFTPSEIADKTEQAMILFEECQTEAEYEDFKNNLQRIVGDKGLAWELYAFIPEICAQNAFDKISYPEKILINTGSEKKEYYKTQFASYYAIVNGVFRTLREGALKDADKVYREYISVSSIWSVICSAKEKGYDLVAEGGELCMIYSPEDDYIAR